MSELETVALELKKAYRSRLILLQSILSAFLFIAVFGVVEGITKVTLSFNTSTRFTLITIVVVMTLLILLQWYLSIKKTLLKIRTAEVTDETLKKHIIRQIQKKIDTMDKPEEDPNIVLASNGYRTSFHSEERYELTNELNTIIYKRK